MCRNPLEEKISRATPDRLRELLIMPAHVLSAVKNLHYIFTTQLPRCYQLKCNKNGCSSRPMICHLSALENRSEQITPQHQLWLKDNPTTGRRQAWLRHASSDWLISNCWLNCPPRLITDPGQIQVWEKLQPASESMHLLEWSPGELKMFRVSASSFCYNNSYFSHHDNHPSTAVLRHHPGVDISSNLHRNLGQRAEVSCCPDSVFQTEQSLNLDCEHCPKYCLLNLHSSNAKQRAGWRLHDGR